MKRTLYLVKCYSHDKNEWARFLVTVAVTTGDVVAMYAEAKSVALSTLPKHFAHRSTVAICHSDREVFVEV